MSTQRRRVLANSGLIIPADGVYIEGLDRKLYTVKNWEGGTAANSVIVASGGVKFRIALTKPRTFLQISKSPAEPLEGSMTAISNETGAKGDYNGAGNTANMLKIVSNSSSFAPGYCNNFIFPDGKTKGFLPSLGQLYLACVNQQSVNNALARCGGESMVSEYYWSSTFRGVDGNNRLCWTLDWVRNASPCNKSLNIYCDVRPFAAIH